MTSNWRESESRIFALPEHDVEAFQVYMNWLYSKRLPVKSEDPLDDEYLLIAKMIVLGDRLQDLDFQDAAVDAILDKSRSSTMNGQAIAPTVNYVYENTLEDSKARKLLVDFYVCRGNEDWLRDSDGLRDLPAEFISDLAIALLQRRGKPDSGDPAYMTDTCVYHNHDCTSRACYKKKFPEIYPISQLASNEARQALLPRRGVSAGLSRRGKIL